MLCKIADILTNIPTEGGMDAFCREYITTNGEASINIDASWYNIKNWPGLDPRDLAYMDSGLQFYINLLHFGGMLLHSSCIVIDDEAYLISGPCCSGKSTHTNLLKKYIGGEIINDDKPALRLINGQWIAYGTPWSGKNHININAKAPVKAICFMSEKRATNSIKKLNSFQAMSRLLSQTTFRLDEDHMDMMLTHIEELVSRVPIYEMESLANEESARLLFETMKGSE